MDVGGLHFRKWPLLKMHVEVVKISASRSGSGSNSILLK